MPLPENIDGLSRAKLKLLLVKLLKEVADLRRAVAALCDDTGRAARIFLNYVHQHLDALGRPRIEGRWIGMTPSGSGIEINLGGYVGLMVGWVEGIEVNILGAVAGVDFRRPALKLPGWGRLGG